MAFGLFIMGYLEKHKEVNLTYLNELILIENNELKNTYLDVYTEPYVFAEYEKEDSKFYIVKDQDYLYIAFISDNMYKEISKKDNLEERPFRIEGYTERIPNDVKKLAIDAYNEAIEEQIVNEENFESYFGNIYINANDFYNSSEIWYLIATLIGILGLAGTFNAAIAIKKSKKKLNKLTAKELTTLAKELEEDNLVIYEKEKLYITKSYFIKLKGCIDVIKIKDIVWYYKEDVRTNGFKTNQRVIVFTKDAIKHVILTLAKIKQSCVKLDNIVGILDKRLSKALVGYTKENIEKVKKLYDK